MIGQGELLVIIAVIVLLFGASAIPKLARAIGKAKSEFEKGVKEGQEKIEESEEQQNKDKKDE